MGHYDILDFIERDGIKMRNKFHKFLDEHNKNCNMSMGLLREFISKGLWQASIISIDDALAKTKTHAKFLRNMKKEIEAELKSETN